MKGVFPMILKTAVKTGILFSFCFCLAVSAQTASSAAKSEKDKSEKKTEKTATEKPGSADSVKEDKSAKEDKKAVEQALKDFSRELMSKMPKNATVTSTDYSGKTWIVSGVYPVPVAQLRKELSESLRAEKYELMHEISLTSDQSKLLIAWKKNDIKLIFMIWKKSDRETGFSWGKSK